MYRRVRWGRKEHLYLIFCTFCMLSHKPDYFQKAILSLSSAFYLNKKKSQLSSSTFDIVFFLVFICESILTQQYSRYLKRVVLALQSQVPLSCHIIKDSKSSSKQHWVPKLGLCFELACGEIKLSPSTVEKDRED